VTSTPPTLVVAGMHRSGTSMTAGVLGQCGLFLGDRLIPADRYNVTGYHEDLDFLQLGMRMARACCDEREPGHHDWGITASGRIDRTPLDSLRAQAVRLVDARREGARPWGFKDPRASLFLDFWHSVMPEARFVLVFRAPWDVVASASRIEDGPFRDEPGLAASAWRLYNRELVAFARRSRERCVVLAASAFVDAPDAVASCLATRLGHVLPGLDPDSPELPRAVDRSLLSTARRRDPVIALTRRLLPDADELFGELNELADVA
jgi:hypothetical protein